MYRHLMSALLFAGLFGSAAIGPSAWAGQAMHSDAQSVAASIESNASGKSREVDAYIRFHLETATGDARSQLMPWPELRLFAQ